MKTTKTRREKGFAIVMTTLALFSTMLIAGLGFDVGTLYLIRTKLQGAMDAAALATVRSLAQSPSVNTAKTVGTVYLVANFPNGYWGAQTMAAMPLNNAITISEIDANGNPGSAGTTATAKLVTVTAGVTAPLYFLRMLGQQTTNISFTSYATRQGLLVMLVLDGSGSMTFTTFNGHTPCYWAQTDAQAFLGYPQFDPDIDRIGAVAFGGNTYTSAPVANFQSPAGTLNTTSQVYTDLGTFDSNCGGNTNTVEGLQQAYNAINTFWAGATPSRANVIVLMTDGAPNGFTANWATAPLAAGSTCGPPAPGGNLTGYVARQTPTETGIFNVAPTPGTKMAMQGIGTLGIIPDNGNCKFHTSGNSYFYQDFTNVPPTDVYGDALYGVSTYQSTVSSAMPTAASPGSTSTTPPIGDSSTTTEWQFVNLSRNAADGAATRLRTDRTYRIAIYCIGLYGNVAMTDPYDAVDDTLLNRVANTPASPIYDPTQPVGAYFTVPDASQLAQAFSQVASAIVARLSK
ncbi:MAG TPA: VWA domain-containing protein [Bryobacteraceae bacterium]|jgi:Flp pilus assembly protein TadG|nr:VWA domain-containing protein [Bryobacteraceae bacterium]